MRFLADESCDFAVVRALRSEGHDVLAVCEFHRRSVDRELMEEAALSDFLAVHVLRMEQGPARAPPNRETPLSDAGSPPPSGELCLKLPMPVMISLLRAVNLAGHNQIRMDELRALCESLGLRDVQTYIQSGNVIFRSQARDAVHLSRRIEDAIEHRFGFRPRVIIRSPDELRRVIEGNPFAQRSGIDPKKLAVTFLAAEPGPAARDKVSQIKADPEELHLDGRHLYIHFPNGMGRSKLSAAALEKALNTEGTARNWNTVTKLLELAGKLQAAP